MNIHEGKGWDKHCGYTVSHRVASKFANKKVNKLSVGVSIETCPLVCLVGLILYVPVNDFSFMSGQVFLCWTSTKQGLMCLAQGHTQCCQWGLNPHPFSLESSTLPLSHCAPTCLLWYSGKVYNCRLVSHQNCEYFTLKLQCSKNCLLTGVSYMYMSLV